MPYKSHWKIRALSERLLFFFSHFGEEYLLLLLLLVPLVGSILFFFEGVYCSGHDDDLMIFCCLICRLGLQQVSNKIERWGNKKKLRVFFVVGWMGWDYPGGRDRETETERQRVWVCVIQGTSSSSEGVHPFMIELMGAAASLHTRYSSMSWKLFCGVLFSPISFYLDSRTSDSTFLQRVCFLLQLSLESFFQLVARPE